VPGVRRLEDRNDAVFDGSAALPIAAARGLRQLVEAGLRPPDPRKIDVHAGLDQRSRDNAARLTIFEPFANVLEDARPI
jgi:hypothetical protein